jgi:hypothetical protein
MKTTKLLEVERVKKFFNILYKLGRACDKKYEDKCEKEVFVRRTIDKWLQGKLVVLYDISPQTDTMYRRYVSISKVRLNMDWTQGTLSVMIYDFARPMDIFESIIVDHNKAMSLEGKWAEDPTEHNQIINLTFLNVPNKEYVFKSYDWNKYPTNEGVTREECLEAIEGTQSFFDTTEYGAYKQRKRFQSDETKIIIGDLIDVK